MIIAFATRTGRHVDEELRRAHHLVVYEVTSEGQRLQRCHTFRPEQRSDERLRALEGCDVVYVRAIGPSLAARVVRGGTQPATAPGTPLIDALLAALSIRIALTAQAVAGSP